MKKLYLTLAVICGCLIFNGCCNTDSIFFYDIMNLDKSAKFQLQIDGIRTKPDEKLKFCTTGGEFIGFSLPNNSKVTLYWTVMDGNKIPWSAYYSKEWRMKMVADGTAKNCVKTVEIKKPRNFAGGIMFYFYSGTVGVAYEVNVKGKEFPVWIDENGIFFDETSIDTLNRLMQNVPQEDLLPWQINKRKSPCEAVL